MAYRDDFKQPGIGRVQNQRTQGGRGSTSVARGDASVFRGTANPEDEFTPTNSRKKRGSKNVPFGEFVENNAVLSSVRQGAEGLFNPNKPGAARFVSESVIPGNDRIERIGRQAVSTTTPEQVQDFRDNVLQPYGSPEEAQAELDAAGRTIDNLGTTRSSITDAPGVNKFVDDRTGATTYSDASTFDDAQRFDGPQGAFNLDENGNQIPNAQGFGSGATVNIGGSQYGVEAAHEVFGEDIAKTVAYNNNNEFLNDILNGESDYARKKRERLLGGRGTRIRSGQFRGDVGTKTAALGRAQINEERQGFDAIKAGITSDFRQSQADSALGQAAQDTAQAKFAAADATAFAASEKSRAAFTKIGADLEIASQKGFLDGNTLMKSMTDFAASDGFNPDIAAQLEAKGLQLMSPQQREEYKVQKLRQLEIQNRQQLGA